MALLAKPFDGGRMVDCVERALQSWRPALQRPCMFDHSASMERRAKSYRLNGVLFRPSYGWAAVIPSPTCSDQTT